LKKDIIVRNRNPKILLLISSLSSGGSERVLSQMSNYWAESRLQVIVVSWFGPPEEDEFYCLHKDIQRINLRLKYEEKAFYFSKFLKLLKRIYLLRKELKIHRPDILLSFNDTNNVTSLISAVGFETKVIIAERIDPNFIVLPWFWQNARKLMYRYADFIVAQTNEIASWLEEECASKNVHIIPNMIRDLPSYDLDREKFILGVGRLVQQKGFDLLIRSFAKVSQVHEDWKLVILGEGNERNNLEELSKKLSVAEKLLLPGVSKSVETWMAKSGLVVHPSRFEGFPNVVLEAMGMGCPVVSSSCSGSKDLITDGVNGRLFPIQDPDQLTSIIFELLIDPVKRIQFGDKAKEVKKKYSQFMIMEKWNELIYN
jgi:GalNAc-alpha-(1->4)-GalNAc-alpha-(1->3)-diNAcBac-PP-undecaprenol alpha-1,4-N-acetyl-D-galactosaminyltransferase